MRECGSCQMCCEYLPVYIPETYELITPEDEVCKHQCPTGCAIYNDRPKPCKTYTCAWLDGDLPEKFKPDICGTVAEIATLGT